MEWHNVDKNEQAKIAILINFNRMPDDADELSIFNVISNI